MRLGLSARLYVYGRQVQCSDNGGERTYMEETFMAERDQCLLASQVEGDIELVDPFQPAIDSGGTSVITIAEPFELQESLAPGIHDHEVRRKRKKPNVSLEL